MNIKLLGSFEICKESQDWIYPGKQKKYLSKNAMCRWTWHCTGVLWIRMSFIPGFVFLPDNLLMHFREGKVYRMKKGVLEDFTSSLTKAQSSPWLLPFQGALLCDILLQAGQSCPSNSRFLRYSERLDQSEPECITFLSQGRRKYELELPFLEKEWICFAFVNAT